MYFTKMIREKDVQQLLSNWCENEPLKGTRQERDFEPCVKLFNPCGSGTWLLTELEPESSLAFGLCDLGMGTPELGYVCLDELASTRLIGGPGIEQDIHFKPRKMLSEYAAESSGLGYIRT